MVITPNDLVIGDDVSACRFDGHPGPRADRLEADDVRRLKEFERENAKPRRMAQLPLTSFDNDRVISALLQFDHPYFANIAIKSGFTDCFETSFIKDG